MSVKILGDAVHGSGKIGVGALQKAQYKKLLRWICGVAKLCRIRNERIRDPIEAPKVGEIAMEVQDRMRNWYGHIMRREEKLRGKNDDGNVSTMEA